MYKRQVVLGVVVIVVATVCPWYSATTVGGSATLAGWGVWRTSGDLNASLRVLPLAVFVYLSAAFMIYGASKRRFGMALVGGMGIVAAGILPFGLKGIVARRLPGSDSVAVVLAAGPLLVLAIGLAVTTVCWIGYARWVLRAAPTSDS